jgi:hypothetical protein
MNINRLSDLAPDFLGEDFNQNYHAQRPLLVNYALFKKTVFSPMSLS